MTIKKFQNIPRVSFSADEFCHRHNVGRNTFYNEINRGRLKTMKVGRTRRVTAEAEREWIQACEQGAA